MAAAVVAAAVVVAAARFPRPALLLLLLLLLALADTARGPLRWLPAVPIGIDGCNRLLLLLLLLLLRDGPLLLWLALWLWSARKAERSARVS